MRILVILILIALISPPLHTDAGEAAKIQKNILEEKKKLRDVRSRIVSEKKAIEEALLLKSALLKTLDDIEESIEAREIAAEKAAGTLSGLQREIEKKNKEVLALEKDKSSQESWLEKRMIALYKAGRTDPAKALFSSDSYISLHKKVRFMTLILQQDRRVIDQYRQTLVKLDSRLTKLHADRQAAKTAEKELEMQRRAAREELKRKRTLLASINRSKVLHEKTLKEMEASSATLSSMIATLESALKAETGRGTSGQFTAFKGRLDFPAEGKIISFFGKTEDPRFKTTIYQKGIEIAAGKGDDIRAVFDGRVLYSDWFRGYGKIMIIDHGDGYYSLSAHASKLLKKVDDKVKKGEVVARVGETGSLKGPHLYFEIRYKGRPVDPLEWLEGSVKRERK